MTAWYNEIDPYAAAWLRNLIAAGHIAPGVVDERSIVDVQPSDLAGFTQCHFFAGIGVWSLALRRAGWPDERTIWTGSCPCQPFSAAGQGGGFDDERHLWPAFHWLIEQCRPPVVLGEQVASKDGLAWLDLVQADLEGTGYASGAVDLCAAGIGAPHIRQRLWWVEVADAVRVGAGPAAGGSDRAQESAVGKHRGPPRASAGSRIRGSSVGLADADGEKRGAGLRDSEPAQHGSAAPAGGSRNGWLDDDDDARLEGQRRGHSPESGRDGAVRPAPAAGEPCGLGHAELLRRDTRLARDAGAAESARGECRPVIDRPGPAEQRPGPTNGLWRDADWLFCRDGKWRPVEPGTFPLAHGAPARVGRLRAYGNAIVADAATAFVDAVMWSCGSDLA